MTQSQLQKIINEGENISVEFKKCTAELNPTAYETICSFLNRIGGHLILGVADDGNISGVNVNCIDSIIKNFINTVNNPELLNPTFYFSPEVFTIENKKVIYIYIPESSQVHRYKGRIYDRVGDADNDITNNHYLINNIYLRKNREFSENEVLPFLEVADLNSSTFRKARQLAGVLSDNHPWLTMDDAEILHACGLWRKDNQTGKEGYTLAAALLFGKENTVLSCCPAYKTDAIYRNTTYDRFLHPLPFDPDVRYDDRDDIRVNLIEAYQRLITFINRNLPDKFYLEGIQRIDLRDKIFREIAANCLIHREFSHSFPAKFLIFSDRVITENWTKPAGQNPVTLDNLETHPKNPMIARVFKELGWVEELGSGRKNIRKYAPYYYTDYQISIENAEKFVFTITYWNTDNKLENEHVNIKSEHVNTENEHVNIESEHVNTENEHVNTESEHVNQINSIYILIDEKITCNISEPVKLSVSKIIDFLLNNNSADGNALALISGKGRSSLTRHLKLLRDANIIEFIGSDKTGRYYLTREAKEKLQMP
ncbi:MAG: putative DNA binding domain-containing protein [Candidatus Symbiothrix sp.]|jgi:ATP-dependent DNA helicase RecG|nr:putative DNA binding domain-containing protein [Candidatus Symbiothrix sp.]